MLFSVYIMIRFFYCVSFNSKGPNKLFKWNKAVKYKTLKVVTECCKEIMSI